jgi:hypothetical protein
MTPVSSLPEHLAGFETQMGKTVGEISLDRTKHQRGLPVAGQSHKLVELGGFGTSRNLGIDRPHPFQ